ncbi:reverse transcriptase family protein [Conexibacter sp. CPCC 206217]|uniref:reverse transcriptase family protein n=1 Tax=Conexibacter sp. CPCC 206217 TaxID=3064574 RepID=UPI00271F276F|nr:reverse transcriptase family protein [Conexibacter sp. CPCC 206217]MDO8209643.1 reverse transcriptase family protein [Conexibacter sp. CPCC 206217]
MSGLPPHLKRQQAAELQRDPETIRRAHAVAKGLHRRGVVPVVTLGHLAHLTGARSRYLREIVNRSRDPYVDIARPKRDGTSRPISSPEPILMDVQRWLLTNVLDTCEPHRCSWAYQRRRSIVRCANEHVGARWLIKLDLHDFYGSVREPAAFAIFNRLGYPRLLSFEMARLCTRSPTQLGGIRASRLPYREKRWLGVLPQGSPTSGVLANAAMLEVDEELAELADALDLVYTRYSDDIVFSAWDEFSRARASALITDVTNILRNSRFRVHRRKTTVVPPGARKIVLGLDVLDDRVALPAQFKRRLEVHVRGVKRFGVVSHAQHRRFRSVLSMVDHVDGCLAFAGNVDRGFVDRLRPEWEAALHANGYPDRQNTFEG